MSNPDHVSRLRNPNGDWNSFKNGAPTADVSGETFKDQNFSNYNFRNTNFSNCVFDNCLLHGVDLYKSDFTNCKFINKTSINNATFNVESIKNINIIDCRLDGVVFLDLNFDDRIEILGSSLSNVHFQRCIFPANKEFVLYGNTTHAINLQTCTIVNNDFTGINLIRWMITEKTNLTGSNFQGCTLETSQFINAILTGCDFTKANLCSVPMKNCNLNNAKLNGIQVDSVTEIIDCKVDHCEIERHTLEEMHDFGKLTVGKMRKMNVYDPLSEMRRIFSGFWQGIHLIALTLFLAPYLAFLLEKYLRVFLPATKAEMEPLYRSFGRFVISGGDSSGEMNSLMLFIFVYSSIYNILRLVLLFYTKSLEHVFEMSKLTPDFKYEGAESKKYIWKYHFYIPKTLKFWLWGWRMWVWIFEVMFLGNVVLVLYHLWHFGHTPVFK